MRRFFYRALCKCGFHAWEWAFFAEPMRPYMAEPIYRGIGIRWSYFVCARCGVVKRKLAA